MDYRDRCIELVEDGMVDPMMMLIAAVKYMSQDEVKEMLEINELLEEEDVCDS
jgi:DNA-binding GntR family transcriptional regulator